MKQYVIDELRPADYEKLKAYLDRHYPVKGFDGLYWIMLDKEILTSLQKKHTDCQPFYFALELLPDRLACELLVRSREKIRCQCIQNATQSQRNWFINRVDAVFDQLELKA